MPYYDVANLVNVVKTNMIWRNTLWLCKYHCCENTGPSLSRRCTAQRSCLLSKSPAELQSMSPADPCRGFRSSKIWLFYNSNLVASWMQLRNSRCFQEHLRMLLHSLRALCLAPGGSGSIWKYFEALVRSPGVFGRIACCFRTDLHLAVVKACFIHSRGCLLGIQSANNPELTTSWCSISLTVRTDAFVDHEGFTLRAAINWTCNCLCTPAVRYTVKWELFARICLYLHHTACCFLFLLIPVQWTILKCVSWDRRWVPAWAALWWTNGCLHSCSVPMCDVIDVAPATWLYLDPLSPGWGGCVSMICWCGIGEEDDNEKKREVLRII